MFFNIGLSKLNNFPVHYQHGNLHINLDAGWKQSRDQYNNVLYYKGYLDSGTIENALDELSSQEEPKHAGNFCIIKCFNQGITVKTDRYRSFPLWYGESSLNNLVPAAHNIWTDGFAMITDSGQLIESKFQLIDTFEAVELEFDEVVNRVDTILTTKVENFTNYNQLPLKVFLSGGIDTMLLYSYIQKLKIPHELIMCSHTDFDYFYLKNHGTLTKFWGYTQIHHWTDDSVLLSGAPGDEFTVRSPTTANMLLRYYHTSIPEVLDTPAGNDCLHQLYFAKEKNNSIWQSQENLHFESKTDSINKCLDIIVNDYQHWHLGHTLTWTPLRDVEIFKCIAQLTKTELINQVLNSTVQKELIKRNSSKLLSCLSTKKNSHNYLENLTNLL